MHGPCKWQQPPSRMKRCAHTLGMCKHTCIHVGWEGEAAPPLSGRVDRELPSSWDWRALLWRLVCGDTLIAQSMFLQAAI